MARLGKARVLNLDEFKKAENAALQTRHAKRNLTILYLSFGAGLRAGEIRSLKLQDVVEVSGKLKEVVVLEKQMTKGHKQREIYLTNPKIKKILLSYIKHLKEKYKYKCNTGSYLKEQYLFPSQKGNHALLANNIVRVFHGIFKKAGIEGAKSHSGRRTFITTKIDEGVDLKAISDLVGHSNIQTTAEYHQKNPNRLKKIADHSIF